MNAIFSGTSQITSSEFDITLMACLLRNLTSLSIKDTMPSKTDTSPGADVSRIKHFRNQISHSEDGKISQQDFNETWDNLSNVSSSCHRYVSLCKTDLR